MKMPWNLTRPIFVLALIGTATVATTTVAAAASPPVAVTGPTSSLTVTGATLTGDVGPIGSATTWYFQYGTTPNYGLRTPSASAGAATSTVAVATRVVGLTPGTTYHERLVATSAAGTGVGSDVVFRTPAVPPSILVASASPVHDTSARVIADINPNGLATTWVVRFGATTSYGGSTAALAAGSSTEPGDHAATLSKLVPNTTYHYDVVATNAAGTTIGPDEHFVTTGPPILSPASFTSLTPTSVTLKATVWPGGHGTVWYFQYGTTTTYTSATAALLLPATTRPLAVSKAIANLEPNTTYHFRLVAKNAAGTVGDADT
ncbi:MAG TPA: hypothetical protein VNT80_06505, partial [Acidimicrobiales bacterium]|nr:hypothetical protein [Acidimicrobiales bacterium]